MNKFKMFCIYFSFFYVLCGFCTFAAGKTTLFSNSSKPNKTIHVDGICGNNTYEGTSRQKAYKTIQYAITQSQDNDLIVVWPGIYNETVDFSGKAITITSGADAAVITNPTGYGVRFHTAEDSDSILKNFVIRDCIIAVQVENSSPVITNITVVNNLQGIIADGVADPNIENSILWSNQFGDLINCDAGYSWIQSGPTDSIGDTGVVSITNMGPGIGSPMFTDPNSNDYHLQSEFGRFYPEPADCPEMYGSIDGLWAMDKVTSPCIDAGNPELYPSLEGKSSGGRINMGAYGGTPYASKSQYPFAADFDRDGIVDLNDFAIFSSQWLKSLPWHY